MTVHFMVENGTCSFYVGKQYLFILWWKTVPVHFMLENSTCSFHVGKQYLFILWWKTIPVHFMVENSICSFHVGKQYLFILWWKTVPVHFMVKNRSCPECLILFFCMRDKTGVKMLDCTLPFTCWQWHYCTCGVTFYRGFHKFQVRFDGEMFKTEVCKKSLNPQWNSEWFKFEVCMLTVYGTV